MMRLSADLPEIVTSALVVPSPVAQLDSDVDDPPRTGCRCAATTKSNASRWRSSCDYERGRGWTPYDVSQDGEHYDIRSESPAGDLRFIEVKGRAQTGAIILTGPELTSCGSWASAPTSTS